MKTCLGCKCLKTLSEFHTHSGRRSGYVERCKECVNRVRRENRPLRWNSLKSQTLKKTFGITFADYEALQERQLHSCGICKRPQSTLKRKFAVDHCHKTGKIRGLLCSNCNTGIGNLRDDANLLYEAIRYLKCA